MKVEMGFSEFLSPVYLPYTLAALVNLYDELITSTPSSRHMTFLCKTALDKAAKVFLHVTLQKDDGSVTMVTVAGREYARHRKTSDNKHIGYFLSFLVHGGLDVHDIKNEPSPDALYQALISTQYRYVLDVDDRIALSRRSFPRVDDMVLTPSLNDLILYLDSRSLPNDIYVSLLWSYGVYAPPSTQLLGRVMMFMTEQQLWTHPHFRSVWYLSFVPVIVMYVLLHLAVISSYSQASQLTAASLRVYREGDIVVSSLVEYNVGLPSVQQWPWAINIDGVPVWCRYGDEGAVLGVTSVGNEEASSETSSARVLPSIIHDGPLLLARYRFKDVIMSLMNWTVQPIMYWPTRTTGHAPAQSFDDDGTFMIENDTWMWGRKGRNYIMYCIRGKTVLTFVTTMERPLDTDSRSAVLTTRIRRHLTDSSHIRTIWHPPNVKER
jgi:hypothetical protein